MITPRPYQLEAVAKSREAIAKNGQALIVLATGLGKTITSALTWQELKGRGLFLVHVNGIIERSLVEYRKVYGEQAHFALFNGYSKNIEGADIVFATFQTMRRNLHRFPRDYFSWMTVDETHHSQAASYKSVIEHFSCPKLGITATPDRRDLLDIREIFGKEVVDVRLEEAVAKGWLPKIEYHLVTDNGFNERALKKLIKEVVEEGKRKISLKEINKRIFIHARDKKVAEIIEKYAEPTIIFCRNIEHAEHFKNFLKSANTYHSDKSVDENRRVFEDFHAGRIKRLLSVNAFNEGMDVPDVGLVVFYRTTDSETIFRQQLGRGLRPTSLKEKLVVLDFVGNMERIELLRKITNTLINIQTGSALNFIHDSNKFQKDRIHISGQGFEFNFTDSIVQLIKIMERFQLSFYQTWQQASAIARKLRIRTQSEYWRAYQKDPQLPSNPRQHYCDFPGWSVFLGTNHYPGWQEASEATQRLNFITPNQYRLGYKNDPRLPSSPNKAYKDFPGWRVFLGKPRWRFYPTWQEAAQVARALGISNQSEYYKKGRKLDARLPACPHNYYENFPGYLTFLGKPINQKYKTWQKSAQVAQILGIKTIREYKKRRKEDPFLPGDPYTYYKKDFSGWKVFLGKI